MRYVKSDEREKGEIHSRYSLRNYQQQLYYNPVFRCKPWALEAGAESHVGAFPHTKARGSSTCPESAFLRISATEKNVEEKSTLMWIMLYGVCGAQAAAMDVQIIRDEEGNSLLPRSKTAF